MKQPHRPGAHSALSAEFRLGNAPCSWGIMGGFEPDPMPTYKDVLDGIAEAGFAGTELGDWGFMPDDAVVLRSELKGRGLAMIGAFTPLRLSDPACHGRAEETALRTARLLRATCDEPDSRYGPFVIVAEASTPERLALAGRARPQDGMTAGAWQALATGLERLARRVKDETGLPTVFHHHSGTHVETLDETERLLDMTDPALIGLCYDSGHFAYAGADPLEAVRRFRGRIGHVHFKDFRPDVAARAVAREWDYHNAVAAGLFCPLGEGAVDFPGILRELQASGYAGWIVVEDEMPPGACDPLENARRDRKYLRELGL